MCRTDSPSQPLPHIQPLSLIHTRLRSLMHTLSHSHPRIPWPSLSLLRRLVKRIYVPLPDTAARTRLVTHLMTKQVHCAHNLAHCCTAQSILHYAARCYTILHINMLGQISTALLQCSQYVSCMTLPFAVVRFLARSRH